MGKFISNFKTTAELSIFSATTAFKTPHVSLTKDSGGVHFFKRDYYHDYFTMVVTVGGNIKWSGSTTANSSTTITVEAGDKVLWKGTPTPQSDKGIGKFSGASSVRYSVEGNAMSLLFGDKFKEKTSLKGKSNAFQSLFSGNINVTSAENMSLPSTTLASNCYYNMFGTCTSLTTAPELPATTLTNNCYEYMFNDCTSLTTAPELPATTLASSCYIGMFYGCTSLTTAPQLPATTLAISCYSDMFNGCTNLNSITCLATNISASYCTTDWVKGVASSGTFTKAASMTGWTSGVKGIPNGWTVQNA